MFEKAFDDMPQELVELIMKHLSRTFDKIKKGKKKTNKQTNK